jgi:hypothetical protein
MQTGGGTRGLRVGRGLALGMGGGDHGDAAAHLDEHGWCVYRGVLSGEDCAASRAMMDEHLGPPAKDIAMHADRATAAAQGIAWGQKNVQWPEPDAGAGGAPVIHTGGYAHSLQHPLYDPRAALPVGPIAPIASHLLRSSPSTGLKLIHQNYRRTDPSPPPHPKLSHGVQTNPDGPAAGFHMDSAFLPQHYESTPRLNYFILITAFSDVVSGGAAFMHAPGSLQAAKRLASALPPELQNSITAKGFRTELPKLLGQGVPGSEISELRKTAHEVLMRAGDVLVLDPFLS